MAMEVLEAIQTRRSVRDFDARPVSKDLVMEILAAATRSPSGANGQPWEIFVASGATLEKIRHAYVERANSAPAGPPPVLNLPPVVMERYMAGRNARLKLMGLDPDDPASGKVFVDMAARLFGAPVVAVICMDKASSAYLDLGLLVQSICLAALHFGVDSLIASQLVAQPDILRPALAIPDSLNIVTGVALGYARPGSPVNAFRSFRRPIEEVVRFRE